MDPWTVFGWLLVISVGLFILAIIVMIMLFLIAGVMGLIEASAKKRKIKQPIKPVTTDILTSDRKDVSNGL